MLRELNAKDMLMRNPYVEELACDEHAFKKHDVEELAFKET